MWVGNSGGGAGMKQFMQNTGSLFVSHCVQLRPFLSRGKSRKGIPLVALFWKMAYIEKIAKNTSYQEATVFSLFIWQNGTGCVLKGKFMHIFGFQEEHENEQVEARPEVEHKM